MPATGDRAMGRKFRPTAQETCLTRCESRSTSPESKRPLPKQWLRGIAALCAGALLVQGCARPNSWRSPYGTGAYSAPPPVIYPYQYPYQPPPPPPGYAWQPPRQAPVAQPPQEAEGATSSGSGLSPGQMLLGAAVIVGGACIFLIDCFGSSGSDDTPTPRRTSAPADDSWRDRQREEDRKRELDGARMDMWLIEQSRSQKSE